MNQDREDPPHEEKMLRDRLNTSHAYKQMIRKSLARGLEAYCNSGLTLDNTLIRDVLVEMNIERLCLDLLGAVRWIANYSDPNNSSVKSFLGQREFSFSYCPDSTLDFLIDNDIYISYIDRSSKCFDSLLTQMKELTDIYWPALRQQEGIQERIRQITTGKMANITETGYVKSYLHRVLALWNATISVAEQIYKENGVRYFADTTIRRNGFAVITAIVNYIKKTKIPLKYTPRDEEQALEKMKQSNKEFIERISIVHIAKMWKNSSYESICNICHRIDEEIENARRPIWDNSMDDEEECDDNQEVSEDDMMNEHIDVTPNRYGDLEEEMEEETEEDEDGDFIVEDNGDSSDDN